VSLVDRRNRFRFAPNIPPTGSPRPKASRSVAGDREYIGMGHRFLLTARVSEPGMAMLRAAGEVNVLSSLKDDQAGPLMAVADALIARTENVDKGLMLKCPKLRIIVRHGVGYDNIDIAAAAGLGIPVAYLPGINSDAVAEHAFGLLFELAKSTGAWSRKVAQRDWASRLSNPTTGLIGKTLGIVGLGNIGRMVAKRALGFEMKIAAYDPFVKPELAASVNATMMGLDELLATADFITLHTPGGNDTKNLFDAARIAQIKPGAFLINTARGTLVDLAALDKALNEGRLAGAGLDVFPVEPPDFSHPIFSNPKVVITPHIASHTKETGDRMGTESARIAIEALAGTKPAALADAKVWPPRRV